MRGRQEHQTLLWGDVELEKTSQGVEFLFSMRELPRQKMLHLVAQECPEDVRTKGYV